MNRIVNKFFDFMDNLPIVRILQVAAVLLFIGMLVTFFPLHYRTQMFYGDSVEQLVQLILINIRGTVMLIMQASNTPLILLALAEIIKHLKAKDNDEN
jgi:hypothetical protein